MEILLKAEAYALVNPLLLNRFPNLRWLRSMVIAGANGAIKRGLLRDGFFCWS